MWRNNVASLKLLFPLSLILLSLIISSALMQPTVYAEELIYKQGDWILYKEYVNLKAGNESYVCNITLKIVVVNVKDFLVNQSIKVESIEGSEACSTLFSITEHYQVSDVMEAKPENGGVFVHPQYTGRYNLTELEGYIEYYKGVLKYVEAMHVTEYYEMSLKVELVDTSIEELQSKVAPISPWEPAVIAILLIPVSIISLAIALVIYFLKKKK